MADDIVQVIQDAREDAVSLSQFIYYPASTMVERRLAPSIHTLNYYLDYLHGLELIYSQPTGTVAVNGEEVKTVRQAINDSVDSVLIGEYQTQLEGRVAVNEDEISSVKLDIQNLPVVEGKIPASEVSVDLGVSQKDKNLELQDILDSQQTELNAQKLDTGITTWSGRTQEQENKDFVTSVNDYAELSVLIAEDGRVAKVKNEGISGEFVFNVSSSALVDDGVVIQGVGGKWVRKDQSSPKLRWWGALGDGTTDDNNAYLKAITFARENNVLIDGEGLTYKTRTRGSSIVVIKNATVQANALTLVFDHIGNPYQIGDRDWQSGMSEYNTVRLGGGMRSTEGYNRGAISIGMGSLYNCSNIHSAIAIGANTLSKCTSANAPSYSLAIGDSALTNVVSDGTTNGGSRNIAIGSLAMHYLQSGYMNVAVGRDAGHNLVNANNNTLIGYGSGGGGSSPIGWSGGIELQQGGSNATGVTAVGATSLWRNIANYNTSVGGSALSNLKTDAENTALGWQAGGSLGKFKSYDSTVGYYEINSKGTYSISGNTVTVSLVSDTPAQLTSGDTVFLAVSTGDLAVETGKTIVNSVNGLRKFTFALPKVGATVGGNLTLRTITTQTPYSTRSVGNVLVGYKSCANRIDAVETIAIGADSFSGNNTTAQTIGAPISSNNVLLGTRAMRDALSANHCTVVGHNAGRWMITGDTANGSYNNITLLGNDTRFSADNQIQLGNSGTTTYAYGAVQDRSDARDKIIEGGITDAHIDFFNDVEFKRYRLDYRDDYIEIDDDGNATKLDKDGSKARKREHVGVIAQQVEEAMKAHNIDFAGLQHHEHNGGDDVYTIGYQEFIPILGEIVQRQQKQIDELMALIKK